MVIRLRIQKRVKLGKTTSLNVSKSSVSLTQKFGKFVTINSRGYVTFSIPKTGISYQLNVKKYFKR
ncbi:DUF4236 domain-containing protein [Turicibacter sanguinis]|uniref:DUF4236 domain-containing protein n=1 Tax=Turicibacter sanguinis TaxID=154288 RepID=UPI003A7F127E